MVLNISDTIAPPKAFIAHPYMLLQTRQLIGRQAELGYLTDWVAKPRAFIAARRILNLVSTGGMGKSALAWKWFNDIAPQEMKPLAGRIWWSFYERDATFENFVTRALAYVTQRPPAEVQDIPQPEREKQLLIALDREPFLIVLDGLERILSTYIRIDTSTTQSLFSDHRPSMTAYPRGGNFVRKLANLRASRILAITRLSMTDLRAVAIEPWPDCNFLFLHGLTDADALELCNVLGTSGIGDSLLSLFNAADNHPLLIQLLAGCVACYRRAPGKFEDWRYDHPGFDPLGKPLAQVRAQVLKFALGGLDKKTRQVLGAIAAFPIPMRYDALFELMANPIPGLIEKSNSCKDKHELNLVLTELERRGLLGWYKRANCYDIHQIIRAAVWGGFSEETQRSIYMNLRTHFDSLLAINSWQQADWLKDPEPTIELANALNLAPEEYKRNVTIIWPR